MSQAKKRTRPTIKVVKTRSAPDADAPRGGKRPSTSPPDEEERKRSEAPTMPPPAPGEAPKHSGRVRRGRTVVTVDVVTADLSKDKRRDE